jgi:hypothetical protein
MQQSIKHVLFVDISKTQIITFIHKFYAKNLYTIDKEKEFFEYLSNVFDARSEVSNSFQENLVLQPLAQSVKEFRFYSTKK